MKGIPQTFKNHQPFQKYLSVVIINQLLMKMTIFKKIYMIESFQGIMHVPNKIKSKNGGVPLAATKEHQPYIFLAPQSS